MSRTLSWNGSLLGVVLAASAAFAAEPPRSEQVVESYLKALNERTDLAAEKKAEAVKVVEELKTDADGRAIAMAEAQRVLNDDFRKALVRLGEENLGAAAKTLAPLRDAADPYLAAEASYFLARCYILDERFEDALPILADLRGKWADKTVRGGESLFLTGVAEGQLLRRPEAMAAFEEFLKTQTDAPERMRVGAFRQLEMLKLIEEGTLSDVHLRMEFSRRRLSLEDSGRNTREQQDKIVGMLAKLIKDAEEKECNCKSSGKGEGKSKGQGKAGESESQAQGEGQGKQGGQSGGGSKGIDSDTAKRLHRGAPTSPWSKLRDRDRDPVFNALKEKFPGRYQELIEQYYKSFQDEDEG